MKLGAFSISLNVKDLEKSIEFYKALGFSIPAGESYNTIESNYVIMKNGDNTTIGLFHGMFDSNILTFNPKWDTDCNTVPDGDDVRDIEKHLLSKGIVLDTVTSSTTDNPSGPAHITLKDPDGNSILIDQHTS